MNYLITLGILHLWALNENFLKSYNYEQANKEMEKDCQGAPFPKFINMLRMCCLCKVMCSLATSHSSRYAQRKMKEPDIIFNFTMVLFSISFAWTISERINHFPKIRRFQSIGAILTIYRQRRKELGQEKFIKNLFKGPAGQVYVWSLLLIS